MAGDGKDAFFIGYINAVPQPLARFLAVIGLIVVVVMAGLGLVLSRRTADPGWAVTGYQHIELRGILEARPYPVLRVPDGEGRKPRAYLLAGEGKYGVQSQADGLYGRWVTVAGYLLKRGTLDMLLVDDKEGIVVASASDVLHPAPPQSLGRWRLTGEICDGKCYSGAMSPGNGLAHKACANLCLVGGVPPVFVSTGAVSGSEYFLLTDNKDGINARRFADFVGQLVSVEGEIERVDNFYIFKSDPETMRAAGP